MYGSHSTPLTMTRRIRWRAAAASLRPVGNTAPPSPARPARDSATASLSGVSHCVGSGRASSGEPSSLPSTSITAHRASRRRGCAIRRLSSDRTTPDVLACVQVDSGPPPCTSGCPRSTRCPLSTAGRRSRADNPPSNGRITSLGRGAGSSGTCVLALLCESKATPRVPRPRCTSLCAWIDSVMGGTCVRRRSSVRRHSTWLANGLAPGQRLRRHASSVQVAKLPATSGNTRCPTDRAE